MLSTRDIGIKYITEGTIRYNQSQNFLEKKNGYSLYVKGIETLISAAKRIFLKKMCKILKQKRSQMKKSENY